ncbi:MAG: DsbA family protein [Candidatus Abyssubacteria bacterium]
MQILKVFSDYICPFCFIGKQRVDRLTAEFPIEAVWRPFEIHPEVPSEGIGLSRFLPGIISNLEASVRRLAEEIGLEIRMPAKLPNSRMALLGGEVARERGVFDDYHSAVLRAYFQESKDIGDLDTLAEIAEGAGMDGGYFREAVISGKHADALADSIGEARSLGLTGVPSFVFSNGGVVIGAQPYDVLKRAAEESFRSQAGR